MNKQSQTIQHTEVGNVVSDRMNKTITVRIERRIRHPLYHKYVVRHKKLHVHDEENSAAIGDVVRIAPCRPLARTKSWRLVEIIRRHDVGIAQ